MLEASELPAPSAEGTLAKTPFSHLLLYVQDRRLTGTIELQVPGGFSATLLIVEGAPAKARTSEPLAYLGGVLHEMACITDDQLNTSLAQMAESPRLHGQILLEMGAITQEQLEAGLRAQLERKIEHLFKLPPETTFAYYEAFDALRAYGGDNLFTLDAMPLIWSCIRQSPPWDHVNAALTRVGNMALRLAPTAQPERFGFSRAELSAFEVLRARPMTVVELMTAKVLGPSAAQLLVYCLVITKQVEIVDAPVSASRPPSSTRGVAPPPPSSARGLMPVPPSSPSPSQRDQKEAQITTQSLGRVQLQARTVIRAAAAIEERPPVTSAMDGRLASPIPPPPQVTPEQPIPPVAMPSAVPATLRGPSAAPAAMRGPSAAPARGPMPNVPDTPRSGQAIPPPPASSRALPAGSVARIKAEGDPMRQRIIERAQLINSQDYFQMLGVGRDATAEQVQKAFFALAKVWHPDKLPSALTDVKDVCSKVFAHMSEAHQTLTDAKRREEYMTLIKEGGATPNDQAEIMGVIEAATDFQKAQICLKRNDLPQAEELARKAHVADPTQADYLAMVAWLEAMKPENQNRDLTIARIVLLDKAIKMNANCERAYFYRGMLHKRADNPKEAIRDFKKAAELNPRNLDAAREVRLHNMRNEGGKSVPRGGGGSRPPASSPRERLEESIGGLFGKLFKK